MAALAEEVQSAMGLLADSEVPLWDEASVPIYRRGVSLTWLTRFVDHVQSFINRTVEVPAQFTRSKKFAPAGEAPAANATAYRFMNTHGLVSQIVKPLTEAKHAPLLAFVPEEFRGMPTGFVSHTWTSILRGPERQRIGTLDALQGSGAGGDDTCVWIDFVCYNQHVIASIANDMCDVISRIGALMIAATPTPLFTRSWCLWELLSASRFQTTIDLRVARSGYRNDKILAVNSLYRSFRGIENARSVSPRDQREIYDGLVDHFGGETAANAGIQKLIEEKFADPWFELQGRDAGLQFSPLPWVWSQARNRERTETPFFLPALLASGVVGSDMTVGEIFKDSGIAIVPPAEIEGVIDSRQEVDEDATLRGVKISEMPRKATDHPIQLDAQIVRYASDQSPLNSTFLRLNCPGCGCPVEYMNRPRYFHSDEPGSPWADFLRGLPLNRCTCGLAQRGSVSSFHTPSWTGVTLEPPEGRALPPEVFGALVTEVMTSIRLFPPLLLFQTFDQIQRAVSRGAAEQFLLVPYTTLIYRDVAETARALGVLIANAMSAGMYNDAYLFIRNAAVIHPEFFWVLFATAERCAKVVDEAHGSGTSLLDDLRGLSEGLKAFRKVPSLDREPVFVCFAESATESGTAWEQTLYALRGHFDELQDLHLLADETACHVLPSWLMPKPPLSVAQKCLLDVHIHVGGEFLLKHGPHDSEAVSGCMRQARERIVSRYPELSAAQRDQVRDFYAALDGRDLLYLIGAGAA